MLAKATRNHIFRNNYSKFNFTYSYNNLPTIHEYYYNDNKVVLDDEITNYNSFIQAFLQKRRVLKYEIPPKISILKLEKQYTTQWNSQCKNSTSYVDFPINTLTVMFDNILIDSNYIKNIFLDNAEENLYESIMRKVFLNGFVPHINEAEKYDNLKREVKQLINIFIHGEDLTNLEKVIEVEYLTQKYEKRILKRKYEENNYKIKLTDKDCMKLVGKRDISIDFSRIEPDGYKTLIKDIFKNNNILTYLDNKHLLKFISKKNTLINNISLFFTKTDKNITQEKIKTITFLHLLKIVNHMESEQFISFFDSSFDFFINHFILCMHIWLIINRFSNFSKSKLALDIKSEIWSDYINMTSIQWNNVDTLRKHRKFKNLENHCKQLIEYMTWHFRIQNNTSENIFYKIDALVWQFVFRERIPRYDERVYKLSYYLINNYNYLQSKSLDELIDLNFDWNIEKIPINYKEILLKYNPVLNNDEYLREKSSNYDLKKYNYFYLNVQDKSEENMTKTYIRYNLHERMNNNLKSGGYLIDKTNTEVYDEANDKSVKEQIEKEYDIMIKSKSNLNLLFWKIGIMKNLFNKLDKEESDRKGKNENINIIQYLPGKNIQRFSDRHLSDSVIREKLHKYRKNIIYNKKNSLKPSYHIYEERVLISPELNISTKLKKRKPLADRLFNL